MNDISQTNLVKYTTEMSSPKQFGLWKLNIDSQWRFPSEDHQINLSKNLVYYVKELILNNDLKQAHHFLAQINLLILGRIMPEVSRDLNMLPIIDGQLSATNFDYIWS